MSASAKAARKEVIRNKIKAIGKMARVFTVLRFVSVTFIVVIVFSSQIAKKPRVFWSSKVFPRMEICRWVSWAAADSLWNTVLPCPNAALTIVAISTFEEAKKLDEQNERMPPALPQGPRVRRASQRGSAVELLARLTIQQKP